MDQSTSLVPTNLNRVNDRKSLFDMNLCRISNDLQYVNDYYVPKYEHPVDPVKVKVVENETKPDDKIKTHVNYPNTLTKIKLDEMESIRKMHLQEILCQKVDAWKQKRKSFTVNIPEKQNQESRRLMIERLTVENNYIQELLDINSEDYELRKQKDQKQSEQMARSKKFTSLYNIGSDLINSMQKYRNDMIPQLLNTYTVLEGEIQKLRFLTHICTTFDLLTINKVVKMIRTFHEEFMKCVTLAERNIMLTEKIFENSTPTSVKHSTDNLHVNQELPRVTATQSDNYQHMTNGNNGLSTFKFNTNVNNEPSTFNTNENSELAKLKLNTCGNSEMAKFKFNTNENSELARIKLNTNENSEMAKFKFNTNENSELAKIKFNTNANNELAAFKFNMNENSELARIKFNTNANNELAAFKFNMNDNNTHTDISNFSFKPEDHGCILNTVDVIVQDQYKNVLENHFAVQKYLENYENAYVTFVRDDSLKSLKNELTKAINTPVNCISSSSAWHMNDKFDKLDALLKCKTVKTGNSSVSAKSHGCALAFCKDTLAKKIINIGEQVVSVKTETAFDVASIVAELWQVHPDFGTLLYARFKLKCPCLVPRSAAKTDGTTDENYYRSLGYLYANGVVEKQNAYVKRMTGLIRLFAAIVATETRSGRALGVGQAWMIVAATLNLDPQFDVTAVLIHEMLMITGYQLRKAYGRQFMKMLQYIDDVYMAKIDAATPTGCGGPVQRLKTFVSNAIKVGYIDKPVGMLPPDFW